MFLHQEIGEDRAGGFHGKGFAQAFLAFVEEIHLGAESEARLFLVEISEKRVVLAVVHPAGCSRSARTFASVVLPTRRGPSMAMKRGA